ncbi:hypothetical protein BAZ12_19590 [Elizabethkingia miricola]|uniref:hypothetical protein n=1 Tax=Elizabethkingia miricola TaxID=172045 RepID=UPI00099B0A5E|nr:hypothetical protein [Elizabethkingia miricola]OPC76215.1 hypothetical protein BAZ12_19590 [Elizabethkingia miricola]
MNKIFTILALGLVSFSNAQFKLTMDNFKNVEMQDKDYFVYEYPGLTQKQIFDKAKMYIHSNFKNLKGDGFNEVESSQIKLRSRQRFEGNKVFGMANTWVLNNVYEFNFKDGKMMIKPVYEYVELPSSSGTEKSMYLTGGSGILGKSIFKKDGSVWIDKEIFNRIENTVNDFTNGLNKSITKNEDW